MKTISVVSTQMQLINCVEYLDKKQSPYNILFITTKSSRRKEQIFEILENQCFGKYFQKIKVLSLTGYRIIDLLLFFLYFVYIKFFCLFYNINICILGNYRDFLGRYLYMNLLSSELIVVDDGLATLPIADGRISEKRKIPFVFYPNRVVQFMYRNKTSLIPDKITFFTIYDICVTGLDTKIHNTYAYLKAVSDKMDIPISLRQADVIFLGQPLYHNILSYDRYSWYLQQFSKGIGSNIIYYPHPEEKYENWKTLNCGDHFKYIENKYSIEILLCSLKDTAKVISFFSSAITNVRFINHSLTPESIYLSEIDYNEPLSYIKLSYNQFEEEGIRVIKYESIQEV